MPDYVVRAISADGQIRGFAAFTKDVVQELQRRHQTFPVVSAALGRTATMGAIMALNLKNGTDRLTIRVDGDGPVGKIAVDANGVGDVRGYVDNPSVLLPLNEKGKLDVAKAVGKGTIYILQDIGLKEPYHGSSPIVSGELAEDFTYYFTMSEQVPTSVGLGVLVNRDEILTAGGYMVQALPGASEEAIAELEKRISTITSITSLLQEGITPEQLLMRLMGDDVRILLQQPVQFSCHCSRAKIEDTLHSLGRKEIESILEDLGEAEVICHFCNEKYLFTGDELRELLAKMD